MARPKGSQPRPERRVRVRSRALGDVDEAKLAVALAMMARRLLEEQAPNLQPQPEARSHATEGEAA
jgi:hypothetical protein